MTESMFKGRIEGGNQRKPIEMGGGVKFRDAMRRVGDGSTVDPMRTGAGGVRLMEKYLGGGVERKKQQGIQGD